GAKVTAYTVEKDSDGQLGVLMFRSMGARDARSAETDQYGAYRIDGLKPGDGTAIAAAEGFQPESHRDIALKSGGGEGRVDFRLAEGLVMRGVVLDGDRQPVADARVSLGSIMTNLDDVHIGAKEGRPQDAHTDASGHFEITGVRKSQYILRVSKSGFL